MYKITLDRGDMHFDMPLDNSLSLFDACRRADIYKLRNPAAVFSVVNEDNGDIEYQI